MKPEDIKIVDESGDRKYFSQLPHYILNHSTAIDQALYWQMKRFAGENGVCFASQETLMTRMGIGRAAFKKSLDYLLEKGWIRFVGMTPGRTRPTKTYAITDIWKLNVMHYEEIPSKTAVSQKEEIPARTTDNTGQNSSKIPARTAVEEESTKEEPVKKIESTPAQQAREFFLPGSELFGRIAADLIVKVGEQNKHAVMAELGKFILYWTEPNGNGTKQRWQLQPTFDVRRRIYTWFSKENRFKNRQFQRPGAGVTI